METKHIILIILLVVIVAIIIGIVVGVIIYIDHKHKEDDAIQSSPVVPPLPPPNNNIIPVTSNLPSSGTYYSSLAAGGATPTVPSSVTTKPDFNTYVDGQGVFVSLQPVTCDIIIGDTEQTQCRTFPCTPAYNTNAVGWQINNNSGYTILPGIWGGPSCQNPGNTNNAPTNVYYSKTKIPPGQALSWNNIPEFTIVQNTKNINFFFTFFLNCTIQFLYYDSTGVSREMFQSNMTDQQYILGNNIDLNSQFIQITITGDSTTSAPTYTANVSSIN